MAGFPVPLGPVGYPLQAYTSIGCYPIYYVTRRNECLCAACANNPECDYGPAVLCDVHYEGEPIECAACLADIESAYGPADET